MISRRRFIDGLACTAVGTAMSASAKSYAQIMGSNERVSFAVIGTNSRALAHLAGLKANASTSQITHICDVDSRNLTRYTGKAQEVLGYAPATASDFRRVLESKNVDAITIATPDHWHAPMAILGLRAGKHVYVEKPSSHNPREGELLVQAQKKYGKLVQVGNQHRSSAHEGRIIQQIHEGRIGRAYFGKAWYGNTRPSMGIGNVVPVPPELNWELWQARRRAPNTKTISIPTIGTGCAAMEPAKRSIMGRMKQTCAVGRLALGFQIESLPRAGAINSRTTGSSMTRS